MPNDRDTEAAPSDALLTAFSGYVTQHLGLHFPRGQWPELVRAAEALEPAGAGACMRRLMAAPPSRGQVEQLAHQLTVGETYFFREPAVFDALEHEVLPALIAARRAAGRTLRIWSAGCCTGEELYSVAILLQRLIPDLADWRITLLGTDVNPGFLRKAEQGRYRDWSFRAVPAWLVWRHFGAPQDGLRAIAPALRRGVRFEYLNLAADLFPGPELGAPAMDLILCRNVLMYFEPASAARALQRLGRALAPDGWLAVGVAEAGHTLLAPFEPVRFPAALLYRQRPQALRPEPTPAVADLHYAMPAA
ncbi:CheR family methyltransferase, partial [Duganella rhizosphaerae]|uniref:CheR family methyltransferase n=1 Tax=Duganella rhizosphaerae TaxID=2885763 RepID=UPI00403FC1A2